MALTLLGGATEGASATSLTSNRVHAFKQVASNNGTTTKIVYHTSTGAAGTATSVQVGIYADNAGKPGTLLAEATVEGNGREAEHTYETSLAVALVKGTTYWIAILPIGGGVRFKLNAVEETANVQRSSANVTTLGAVAGWASDGTTGSTLFLEAVGVITLALAGSSSASQSSVVSNSVRIVAQDVSTTASTSSAINPASKGKVAESSTNSTSRAVVASVRRVTAAISSTTSTSTVSRTAYGNAEVYAYGTPSVWRVVEPLKAATPGSPVIIYLHESDSDEPSDAEAANKLPRVGESLAETLANGRKLSCRVNAQEAVANGFCCFVPAYSKISTGYPTPNNDIDALIVWVKQHAAAWNGDPNKVCIIGGSFGVLYGFHEALRLNAEKGAGYITACAGLSGPIDIPSRVKGRDEELAALEAWEAAHPGFTEAERTAWKTEHNFANTNIVKKLANYLNVSEAHLQELGWLTGPSAEQKAALKLAEELSPFYNLATMFATMPYLWYAVSKEDITPQQQGEQMSEAAAAHGQPGKYHFNASIPNGHAFGFYSEVQSEIYAYFRLAVSPPTVALAASANTVRSNVTAASVRRAALNSSTTTARSSDTVLPTGRVQATASHTTTQSLVTEQTKRLVPLALSSTRVSSRSSVAGLLNVSHTTSTSRVVVHSHITLKDVYVKIADPIQLGVVIT